MDTENVGRVQSTKDGYGFTINCDRNGSTPPQPRITVAFRNQDEAKQARELLVQALASAVSVR